MVRVGRSSWLSSFSAIMVGLVLVFAGFAALGWWLAATGEQAFWQSLGTGITVVVCFSVGLAVLVPAIKRRGGLLTWRPTHRQREIYRAQDRRG